MVRRQDAWDKVNMDVLRCKIKKDVATEFKEIAKAEGTNVSALLASLVRECIKEHKEHKEHKEQGD